MVKVLFDCEHEYYWPQFFPVGKEMIQRGVSEISLSFSPPLSGVKKRKIESELNYHRINWIESDSNPKRIRHMQNWDADIIFVGNKHSFHSLKKTHNKIVMVYHGIGLKQSYYRDIPRNIDLVAVESENRMTQLLDRGFSKTQLVLTGFTKLDPLVNSPLRSKAAYLESLALNPEQPVILYAPTFYPSSVDQVLPRLKFMQDSVQWIIALHPFSWTKEKYKHHRQLSDQLQGYPHICVLKPHTKSLLDLMQVSDILVTDISSVLFEYLSVNKPIIQVLVLSKRINHRLFPWILSRRLDLERSSEIDFTTQVRQIQNLSEEIRNLLRNPTYLEDKRLGAQHEYLYKTDGLASSRLVDAILRFKPRMNHE